VRRRTRSSPVSGAWPARDARVRWWRAAWLGLTLLMPALAGAQDAGTGPAVTLRTSLKGSLLAARSPSIDGAAADTTTTAFWRARLEPRVRIGPRVRFEFAYEHRAVTGANRRGLTGLLSSDAPAPYRLRPLDWSVTTSPRLAWRHEVDRLALAVTLPRAEITLGRQAIGWGRGVLFGAVDLFAPFSPLEPDREWRRGVDAARADIRITDRVSFDAVSAFGPSREASALAGRLRGYAGRIDVEFLAGRRARDGFAGVTSSAALGDVEVHGELAIFAPAQATAFVPRAPVKAVVGGSSRVPLGQGVLVHLEYHYSGFGAARPGDIGARWGSEDGRTRYARGDAQVLGRHAIAVLATYEASPTLALGGHVLQSPRDGSGVVVPIVTLSLGDRWSIVTTGYLPHGQGPRGGVPRSEYGGAPRALVLQARLYL